MRRTAAAVTAFALVCAGAILQAGTAQAKTVNVATGAETVVAARACVTDASLDAYTVLDGTASAGDSLYAVFSVPSTHPSFEKRGGTVLTRWNISTGVAGATCEAWNNDIDLGHGNDITWVPSYGDAGTPVLMIPKGVQKKDAKKAKHRSKKVVVVNPADLTAVTTLTFPHNLSGLCYRAGGSPYHYAAHFQDRIYLYKQDATSRPVIPKKPHSFAVHYDTTSGEQGLFCTSSYVYSVRSVSDRTPKKNKHYYSYIYRYRWGASKPLILRYDAGASLKKANSVAREVESLFQVGTQAYLGVNRNRGGADAFLPITSAGVE